MFIRVKRVWKLFRLFARVLPVLLNARDVRFIAVKVRGVNPFIEFIVTPEYIYIKNKGTENSEA